MYAPPPPYYRPLPPPNAYCNMMHMVQAPRPRFIMRNLGWRRRGAPSRFPAPERCQVKRAAKPKFSCQTCSRDFHTQTLYNDHINCHIKCEVEYCDYAACPRLVEIHYEQQHLTGLAKQIWTKLDDQGIKDYLAERKRKYPTTANVERKTSETEAKLHRGDVLISKDFGKMRKSSGSLVCNQPNKMPGPKQEEKGSAVDPLDSMLSLNQANDASNLKQPADEQNSSSALQSSSLTSLAVSYQSDFDSDDEDTPTETRSKPEKTESNASVPLQQVHTPNWHPKQTVYRKGRFRRPTLLEMLLSNEIRKERNQILQCVRHIVRNNFFHDIPLVICNKPTEADTIPINDEVWE